VSFHFTKDDELMTTKALQILRLLPVIAILATVGLPASVSAQSELDTSEAQQFLGDWTIALQTDMGPMDFGLSVSDAEGRVAAQVQSPMGNVDVSSISRSGDNLVLNYSMNAQGQDIPVSMTLRPDGDNMRASMDFAGGMFVATGTATKDG